MAIPFNYSPEMFLRKYREEKIYSAPKYKTDDHTKEYTEKRRKLENDRFLAQATKEIWE